MKLEVDIAEIEVVARVVNFTVDLDLRRTTSVAPRLTLWVLDENVVG